MNEEHSMFKLQPRNFKESTDLPKMRTSKQGCPPCIQLASIIHFRDVLRCYMVASNF